MCRGELLKDDPAYRRGQRVWWILLGAGFGATVISTILMTYYPDAQADPLSVPGLLSIALIVLAYGGIVSALIYDWRKVKPLRTAAEAAVSGMSDKKVAQILRQDAEKEARRKAQKAEARAARRGVRNTRHE
ncbi:hypothetical protein [Olsenella massiliensis]|uniref:hypothetical protein n=1 Tax=Olsenella massiliensis TaxID=1622075 RepID=UPI00071C9D29|nr:hypothetical protein [Olsenella massiliensis]